MVERGTLGKPSKGIPIDAKCWVCDGGDGVDDMKLVALSDFVFPWPGACDPQRHTLKRTLQSDISLAVAVPVLFTIVPSQLCGM